MSRIRKHLLDGFLVLLAAAEVASVLTSSAAHKPAAAALSAISVLVFLGRRWQPLAASVAAFAALTVLNAVMPRATLPQFFGVLVTFALAGAINREREAVVAWLAGAGMFAYTAFVDPYGGQAGDFALSLAFGTMLWGAGLLVSRRARQTEAATLRAELAERDRQEQARRAVVEERARIARELHDIVSHGLSVVVLQTLAARAELVDGGDGVDRHLDAVESTARDALGEMRRMLGLLQTGDGEPEPAGEPQRGLRSVAELVDRAITAGVRVTSVELPSDVALPSGLDLAVYRVVQEALTNVAKHAPGAATSLAVRVGEGEVVVRVTNAASATPVHGPAGAGQGLVGMRQRVQLYGGSLVTGPIDDGGFAVTATFALDDASVPAAARP
jgi:signal transduction histidine kinase